MPLPTLPQLRKELDQLKELAAAKMAAEAEPKPENEVARSLAFTFSKAARGKLAPAALSRAKSMHFMLFGTPEINASVWGPAQGGQIVTISQECNKLAPVSEADALR